MDWGVNSRRNFNESNKVCLLLHMYLEISNLTGLGRSKNQYLQYIGKYNAFRNALNGLKIHEAYSLTPKAPAYNNVWVTETFVALRFYAKSLFQEILK